MRESEWREKEWKERNQRSEWKVRRSGGASGGEDRSTRRQFRGEGGGNITSFFVSNFSDNVGEIELWKSFQRWGRIWEVFIPHKRDRSGRRIGFVRFLNIPNPPLLTSELDQILIGGKRLHVNITRFAKAELVSMGRILTPKDPGVPTLRTSMECRDGFMSYANALTHGGNRAGATPGAPTF